MAKRKQSKLGQGILFAAGVIFICGAVYFFIHNIYTYIQQFAQEDWTVTTATVINVEERSGGHKHHRTTRYDIYYQYEAGGNIYTNTIYGLNAAKNYGDTFDIKYDPDSPKDATHYLKPTFGIVVSGIIALFIFGVIGLFMVRNALPEKKKFFK